MNKERIMFLQKDFVQGFPATIGLEVVHVDYGRFESRLGFVRITASRMDSFMPASLQPWPIILPDTLHIQLYTKGIEF